MEGLGNGFAMACSLALNMPTKAAKDLKRCIIFNDGKALASGCAYMPRPRGGSEILPQLGKEKLYVFDCRHRFLLIPFCNTSVFGDV